MDLNERIMTAIDMLTAMVVDEIALDDGRDPSDVLPEFLESRTAKLLYERGKQNVVGRSFRSC